MLELSNIVKNYQLKDQTVTALKGVSVCFRRNEFVSILGPSGCGKTTLLNIIGGLDKYTSGDLIIDGVSTKDYKDKDWDNYRNHRVGFVFQSYNLIPHQTVLENVELALTLSGIKRAERRKRAVEVLEKVGLGDKLKSKPNQLSGGQMQRVAIARALVNDPEIILADEPTGALDSKTSVQIMDLLKEVSADRLVIMVTHNPDLAEQYSNRIIRLLDGEVIEDSKPYSKAQSDKEIEKHKAKLEKTEQKQEKQGFKKTKKKKSMSIFTAMFLSLKNLLTKKGRTIMVAFAGSIGILGIALILAVSAGMNGYIDTMQSQSLSSYPIAVASLSVDLGTATNALMSDDKSSTNQEEVGVYDLLESLKNYGKYNVISPDFVNYVNDYYKQENKNSLLNDRQISYASEMRFLTQTSSGYFPIVDSITFSAFSGSTSSIFFQGLNNEEYVRSMYNVVGEYPKAKNEIALVLNSGSIDSMTLQSFGIDLPLKKEDGKFESLKFSDLINKKSYRLFFNDAYFKLNPLADENLDFNEVLTQIAYLSTIINAKEEEPAVEEVALTLPDVETEITKEQAVEMLKALQLSLSTYYSQFDSLPNKDELFIDLKITGVLTLKDDVSGSIYSDGLMYTQELAEFYHENCQNSKLVKALKDRYLDQTGSFKTGAEELQFPNNKKYVLNISELSSLSALLPSAGVDKSSYNYARPSEMIDALNKYFKIEMSDSDIIDLYLQIYGASNIPTGMYFYVKSFEGKDDFMRMIDTWNDKEGVYKISIADSTSFLTSMLKSLVNIISYVLVAFAAISLLVSSIMIAIITYTSVIERTKEIGVLRSVGASKRDVSRVFNAETIIIGLLAGLFGVALAGLLTIPISLVLKALTGVGGLAVLNPLPCLILILISMFLTFIAGLVPARIASKKDPVLALRTE